jgi:hypothetical protein
MTCCCWCCVCCRYGLGVHYLKNPDFKAGLEEYLAEAGTAAIVLGTRRWVACYVHLVARQAGGGGQLP